MRVYISGKISGLPEAEELFEKAEQEIKYWISTFGSPGEVINPMKLLPPQQNPTWEDYMLKDIEHLFTCDMIFMLTNWKDSRGARIEHAIAIEKGMRIFYQREKNK